jgi:hypothetical protein
MRARRLRIIDRRTSALILIKPAKPKLDDNYKRCRGYVKTSKARQTAAAMPSPALAVPASLHASLMARLDRLGPAKDVAQIGAAIGREFSHALLAAVVRKPEAELRSALDRLIAAGLLFRQGVPPQATYLFKHALLQDAAYGTLLREPPRALHAHIAETSKANSARLPRTIQNYWRVTAPRRA